MGHVFVHEGSELAHSHFPVRLSRSNVVGANERHCRTASHVPLQDFEQHACKTFSTLCFGHADRSVKIAVRWGRKVTQHSALHAQAKAPAFMVIEINKINDAEGFKTITQRVRGGADVAKELGGHYVARTDKITALDGTAPQRFIAYAFDSVEKSTSL